MSRNFISDEIFYDIEIGDIVEVEDDEDNTYQFEVVGITRLDSGKHYKIWCLVPPSTDHDKVYYRTLSSKKDDVPSQYDGKTGSYFYQSEIYDVHHKSKTTKQDPPIVIRAQEVPKNISSDGKWLSNIDKFKGENPPGSPFRWL